MPPYIPPSPGAALIAGLVTSLHCAGMCGPIACAILPGAAAGEGQAPATAYHAGRLGAYGLLGALAGGLGRLPLSTLPAGALRVVPVLSVLFFLGLALGWDRRWVKPIAPARWLFRAAGWLGEGSPMMRAGVMGLATPLLPCGALYFMIALALLAGSAVRGVEIMLAFGIGTVPLLWVAQAQFARLQTRLSPRWLGRVRVTLAVMAAAVAAWRARMAFGTAASSHPWLCF
jgi:sulfite exporter TauE/SafE